MRAYAINADGAVYGNEISFDTAPGFVDNRDGTVYPVVTIGNQVWMAENLKYLPSVNLPNEGSNSDPRYYVYGYSGNDVSAAIAEENYAIYGVLYNWPAAMAGEEAANATVKPSGVKGVCPDGWHLPNEAEWEELFLVVGTKTSRQNYSGGGALKESGTEHWDSPNTGANNGYGFTVLPAGHKDTNHVFVNLGVNGYFWNSSLDTTNPWYWMFRSAFSTIYASSVAISSGHSVRCLCN